MLDFDLAEMYEVETKRLKEAVRRNMDRFEGDDFMIILTKEEVTELSRTQFATMNKGRGYNIKYAPFAFTELCKPLHNSVNLYCAYLEPNYWGLNNSFDIFKVNLSPVFIITYTNFDNS